VLIASVVVAFAAWHAPFFSPDRLAAAIAVALTIGWLDSRLLSNLLQAAVFIYFVGCAIFIVLGSDAVKLIALGDAAVGLAGVGIAIALRRAVIRFTPHVAEPLSASVVGEFEMTDRRDLQSGLVATESTTVDEPAWTPIQFSLANSLKLLGACSAVFAVVRLTDFSIAFALLVSGMIWIVFAGCYRLVTQR